MGFTVLLVAFLSAVTMAFWLRLPQGNWTRLRQLCAELSEQGVEVSNISDLRTGFQIAGPNARAVLEKCTETDISPEAFQFLDVPIQIIFR